MNFEFSLAQLTILNTSPIEIATIASECGYDYVSLRQIYMNLPEEKRYELIHDKNMLKELKNILRLTNLKILDIELARIFDGVNVKDYEKVFELANELGVKYILSSVWSKEKSYYMQEFNNLCELANKYGLIVNLEYVPIASVNNLSQAMELIETVKTENAALMVDMHHFHRAKDKIEDLKNIDKKYFHFAHLCDATPVIPDDIERLKTIMRQERLYVGEGGINISDILNSIPIVPYSIELPNKKQIEKYGYKYHAKQCLIKAKEYCQKYVKGR